MPDKYVCQRKCFHRNVLYDVGDSYTPYEGEEVPRHFVPVDVPNPPTKPKPEEDKPMTMSEAHQDLTGQMNKPPAPKPNKPADVNWNKSRGAQSKRGRKTQ